MNPQPPTLPTKPAAPRRAARGFWSDKPDVRSVQIGVVATIAVHVLLIALAPKVERWLDLRDGGSRATADEWASREFQIELAPADVPAITPEPEPPPMPKFVEANPNAPDNVPDKTDNIAAQNQQVAQAEPTPAGKSDAPAVKGDQKTDATAIVSGELQEPQPLVRPSTQPENREEVREQEAARRLQETLPGSEKFEGDNPDGVGSNVGKQTDNASPIPERVEGQADAKNAAGPRTGLYFKVDAKRPQPRPTLAPDVVKARQSPLANREFGTENIGAIAYDAKWSAYGEYLQKFIETVDVQWRRIIDRTDIAPVAGTKVVVRFRMNKKGDIARILKVESNGGRAFETTCVSAIVARAPYGEWPEDMVGVLGEHQDMTFTFHYR